MNDRRDLVGAVLAGGASRRMGRDKAALLYEGQTLAGRAAARLERLLPRVVVACGRPRELGTGDLPQLPDHFQGCGPLAGIHAALVDADGHPVLALACDLPLVTVELLAGILRVAASVGLSSPDPAWAVVAAAARDLQPLCAAYGPGCLPILEATLSRGNLRVADFLLSLEIVPFPVPDQPGLPARRQLANLNRPEDLEDLLCEAGRVEA